MSVPGSAAPLVSVVVLNWERPDLTRGCLQSLQRQSYPSVEIVLVDNGSRDDSVEALAREFPEVELIALEANRGFCGGNNVGIERARGDYVALLNNDAEADPEWLAAMVRAVEARSDVGFCAAKMLLYDDPERLDAAGDCYTVAGTGAKIGHRERANDPQYNRPKEVFGACAGAALYRRAMLAEIGTFDEAFFINQEDVDLSFRAQLKGYRCLYVPEAVVYHRLNATLTARSDPYVYTGHRNLEYVYVKNMPGALLGATLPLHVLDVLASAFYFTLIGRGAAFWRGKRDALRALPRLWAQRRRIQRVRTASVREIAVRLERGWLRLKWRRWRRSDR